MNVQDAPKIAKQAGLHYFIPDERSNRVIRRRRQGKSFRYYTSPGLGAGRTLHDDKTLARIRKLAIPPAYEEVVIAADPLAHLQAVGRDARGRKQYRYHPRWLEAQGEYKYQHIIDFAEALPRIRRITGQHLRKPGLCREKLLAVIVQLLEKTLIRIGNDEYVRSNHSYGLSTLRREHVRLQGDRITFDFLGKSRVQHEITIRDRRIARVIRECTRVGGRDLFEYEGPDGNFHRLHSHDVNEYLRSITGKDLTAKDFRTWGATVLAAQVLSQVECPPVKSKMAQALNGAIDQVASKLGNTRSICRKSYIHPQVLETWAAAKGGLKSCGKGRKCEEWVLDFLKSSFRRK